MTKLTKEAVIQALEEIVAETGTDYVYPRAEAFSPCVYAEQDGTPSCLVGRVIAKLDPEAFENVVAWELYNGNSFGVQNFENPEDYPDEPDVTDYTRFPVLDIDPEAKAILEIAQKLQDTRSEYGEAVSRAIGGDNDDED